MRMMKEPRLQSWRALLEYEYLKEEVDRYRETKLQQKRSRIVLHTSLSFASSNSPRVLKGCESEPCMSLAILSTWILNRT